MASDQSCAAARVFGIAELAEKIILDLDDFTEILKARVVNQSINQIILDSMLLKQKLFLAPMPGDKPQKIHPKLPKGWSVLKYCSLRVRPRSGTACTKRLWRKMFLTQPPIRSLSCRLRSKCDGSLRTQTKVENENGLTLGEVKEAARSAMRMKPQETYICCRKAGYTVEMYSEDLWEIEMKARDA